MAASTDTFAESHKRTLAFVFTLKIFDNVYFYCMDITLKCTAIWLVPPSFPLSTQLDSWRQCINAYLHSPFPRTQEKKGNVKGTSSQRY